MFHYYDKCYLKIGQHSTINCTVSIDVKDNSYDEFNKESYDPNAEEIEVTGEFSFEAFPITDLRHPVKRNTEAFLTLRVDDDFATRIRIKILDRTNTIDVSKGHVKKYCWSFCGIGLPFYDGMGLFPTWFKQNMNKTFYSIDFKGTWPVAAIVVARDIFMAKKILIEKLKSAKLYRPESENLTMVEVDSTDQAIILQDGTY